VRSEAHILSALSLALGRPFLGSQVLTRLWPWLTSDRGLSLLMDTCGWPARLFFGGRRGIPSLRPRAGRYLGRGPRTPGQQVRFWHAALSGEAQRLEAYVATLEAPLPMVSASAGTDMSSPHPGLVLTLLGRRRRLGHNSWLHSATHAGETDGTAWLAMTDYAALGLETGDEVVLQTATATLQVIARPRADVMPGTVVVPHGVPEANINALIPTGVAMLEPLSGQHRMTGIPVRVTPIAQAQ
jgi:anaerobic selenocysteine-containing dehydrogenase